MMMSVLWITHCSAYSEPMASHALGILTGARSTLPHMQQRAAGERYGRHSERMTSCQKSDSINRCGFN